MKKIIETLKNCNHAVLLTHVSPDSDALGSCFALKHALEKLHKTADVLLCSDIPKSLSFITGEYQVYDPEKEYPCDLLICLDSGSVDRLDIAAPLLEKQPNSINIDHHKDNVGYAALNHVEGGLSATGEILYRLLSQMELIDETIAFYLYAAICADTGGFRYSNTTPATMRAAADLMEYGADFRYITRELFEVKDMNILQLEAELMGKVESYACGQFTCVSVDLEQQKRYGLAENDVNSIVNIARNIRGVKLAASFKETEEKIKVSLRSECDIDVGLIANTLGGGGHAKAAGIALKMPLSEAKEAVKNACIAALNSKEASC